MKKTAQQLWNDWSIAERLTFVKETEKATGQSIGHSNSKQRYDKISSILKKQLESATGSPVKVSSVKAEPAKVAAIATESAPKSSISPEVAKAVFGTESSSLDLLISFDDTGSMSSVRRQVRQKVNDLVKELFGSNKKLKVGIIIHNDYCDSPRHLFTLDFTNDIKAIEKFVNQDSPCGGGDAAECYELALKTATEMTWTADKRACIVIGDEVPHNVGYSCYGRDGKKYTNSIDWKVEAAKLGEMGVQVYGVQALGSRSSTFFYEGIAKYTGGVKLDLSQFQHIVQYINAIAYHQQGTLEVYEKSDPSFSTNISLKNMFRKLRGAGEEAGFSERVELLSRFQVMNVETDGHTTIQEFVNAMGCIYRRADHHLCDCP